MTQPKSLTSVVHANNTLAGDSTSGDTNVSAGATETLTGFQLTTSCTIVAGVFVILTIAHFIATTYHFSRVCIALAPAPVPLDNFTGNVIAPDVDDGDAGLVAAGEYPRPSTPIIPRLASETPATVQ